MRAKTSKRDQTGNPRNAFSAVEETKEPYLELEKGIYAALETYSNVHRGSGHSSMVSTHLYEQARDIVLEFFGLKKGKYVVIFCTPRGAHNFIEQLNRTSYQLVSSKDIGLALGVRAIAIKRNDLPKGIPMQTGGGTTKLISKDWVIWADAPDKFEAGTPSIINVIAFARALKLVTKYGYDIFQNPTYTKLTVENILYNDELEKYQGMELLIELRKTLIGRNISIPTMEGLRSVINLDNSASTPTFEPVWNVYRHVLNQPENIKNDVIVEVKSIIAYVLDAPKDDYDVIFTSNTTEAINLAAENLGMEVNDGFEPVVLNTILEHSSNELPWRMIPGHTLIRLDVDYDGFINLKELETILIDYNQNKKFGKKRIKLVAFSGASNVLGVCNNIEEISRLVHKYGALLLVDAAQLVAHRSVDIQGWDIDYLAFSAHKVYAPFGTGVLVVRKGLLNFSNEEQIMIKSSGEENAGGIAAIGKALLLLNRIGMNLIRDDEQALSTRALMGMKQIPDLKIHGLTDFNSSKYAHKLGVIVFDIKNKMPSRIAKQLALQSGIGVRYGCHCAHIIVKHILHISPFLEQFQRVIQIMFPRFRFLGIVRVSLGIQNTEEDVDKLISALYNITSKKDGSDHSITNRDVKLTQKEVQQQIEDFVLDVAKRVYL